jgi:hypothetical protein
MHGKIMRALGKNRRTCYHWQMITEQSGRKRRDRETAERRSKRLEQGAEDRKVAREADDANVQRMIERSIKSHGA